MLVLRYDTVAKVVIYQNSFGHEFKSEFVTNEGINEYMNVMIKQFKMSGKKYVVKPICPVCLEDESPYTIDYYVDRNWKCHECGKRFKAPIIN